MKLQAHETEVVGKWIAKDDEIRRDATCERIEQLTKTYLKQVAVSKELGAWEILFEDPADGRFWERTYLQSNLHGGGPPSLRCLSADEAKRKYGDVAVSS